MIEIHDSIHFSHLAAERAIDELRRQNGIVIQLDDKKSLAVFPVEYLQNTDLSALLALAHSKAQLLFSGARAKAMGLPAQDGERTLFAVLADAQTLTLDDMRAIADPLKAAGERRAMLITPAGEAEGMILKLAKYASLLPALLLIEGDNTLATFLPHWQSLSLQDLSRYLQAPILEVLPVSHSSLPIKAGENATLISFRTRFATGGHLALVMGDITRVESPLTRIHSSCVTGDILGSLRCDCGDQLQLALQQIRKAGAGILLYLYQEGRGIGISNKLRAYQLQDQGYDTYDANLALGYGEDERDFAIAAAILKQLNVSSIRMLTNNPHKIAALEQAGIKVAERVPLIAESGDHNQHYLDTKGKKAGHLF